MFYNPKEYDSIDDLYSKAKETVAALKENGNNKIKIEFIRNNYKKSFLHGFFKIGELELEEQQAIGSHSKEIRLSIDSLVKNIIEHPEITLFEYKQLALFIKRAEYTLLKGNKNLIYFKISDKLYQFVIKRTENRAENYITTFHKTNTNQLSKDLQRYKAIKR